MPFDRWIGLWTCVLLIPLIPIYYYINDAALLLIFSTLSPLIVALILGWWKGRFSASAILIQCANAAGMTLIFLTDRLTSINSCINTATNLPIEQRLQGLSYCAEITRFWLNLWLTISFGLITVFGGAIISIYLLKPEDYGSTASKKISTGERQVLAILYSVSIIWMEIVAFAWVGVPAIQYLTMITDLQNMLNIGK